MTVQEIKEFINVKLNKFAMHQDARAYLTQIKSMLDQLDDDWVDVRDRLPSEEEIKENNGMFEVTTYAPCCEECVDIKEFRNGKFITDYAIVIGWRPRPEPYKREE